MLCAFECWDIAWKFDKKSKKIWLRGPINLFVNNSSLYRKRISNALLEISQIRILKSELFVFFIKWYSDIIPFSNDSLSLTIYQTNKGKNRSWHSHIRHIIVPVKNKTNEILVLRFLQVKLDWKFPSFQYQGHTH